jgi:hypothetical protein
MLPIVQREMQVAARRRGTFIMRSFGAAMAVLWMVVNWIDMSQNGGMEPNGKFLLKSVTVLGCIAAVREGWARAAKSLSEERARGTLGLLFLTPLKPFDVVFGKFASASLQAFQMAVTLAPLLAVTALLGGVTIGEVARASLWIANIVFVFVAISLLASALTASELAAMVVSLAFVGVVVLYGLFDIERYGFWWAVRGPRPRQIFFNPIAAWLGIDDVVYRGNPEWYWGGMIAAQVAGWLMLTLTARVVQGNWQRPVVFPKLAVLWTRQLTRPPKRGRVTRLGNTGPLEWLMLRNVYPWGPLILVVFCFLASRPFADDDTHGFMACLAMGILVFGVVVHSALAAARARKAGLLELVAVAPISDEAIVAGQIRGLKKLFFAAAGVSIAWLAAFIPWRRLLDDITYSQFGWFRLYYLATLALTLWAAAYTGIWMALKTKGPAGAVTSNAILTLAVPWIFPGPAALYLIVLGTVARQSVRSEFRTLLTGRKQSAPPFPEILRDESSPVRSASALQFAD